MSLIAVPPARLVIIPMIVNICNFASQAQLSELTRKLTLAPNLVHSFIEIVNIAMFAYSVNKNLNYFDN